MESVCKPFQLFGMGRRRKLVYQNGTLRDALNGEVIYSWEVRSEKLLPGDYRVELDTCQETVTLREDETAVWLETDGQVKALSRGQVNLPDFPGHPQADLLRALHAELLVNVMPWGPVPNLWVYSRPWYRDAAMMALAFEKTGNVEVLRDWIDGLEQPFDFNNRGAPEPDNLGQILFLASLGAKQDHPIVKAVLKEIPQFRKGDYIIGKTDGREHPVYQTKWLKYGLSRLSLDDPYVIPGLEDSYSALFWMDYQEKHVPVRRFEANALENYPYLNWAEAHFYGEPPPEPVTTAIFPLSRERHAGEAAYNRMALVSEAWKQKRWSSPHTWHAAEMFLYFLDLPQPQ